MSDPEFPATLEELQAFVDARVKAALRAFCDELVRGLLEPADLDRDVGGALPGGASQGVSAGVFMGAAADNFLSGDA